MVTQVMCPAFHFSVLHAFINKWGQSLNR